MKQITRTLPLILATALQLVPLLRNLAIAPAAGGNLAAFILRWGIGIAAGLESVDAVSGATSAFTTPGTFSGAVGTPFSANVTVSIGGGNTAASGDYILVSAGVNSSLLMNGQGTTVTLPPGLTFTASWVNNATTIGGIITGTPTTAGTYSTTVTIVSPGNASLSQAITITITGTTTPTAPAITTPPVATSVIAGKNAAFTVTASGTAPLGYYWLKNNSPLANGGNVSGANTATLALTGVTATDAANYSVLVSNSVGTATSAAAALTVVLPPTISTQPAAQTVATGANANFSVTATGSAPLAYQWLKGGATIANGTKYSGVTTSALTVAAVAAADAGNFSVVVTNLAGSVTSSVAALTIVATPTITTPPANVSVVAGTNASFSVTAAGSAPVFYFWQKNSSPLANAGNISGANTATLNLAAVTTADAASYSVIVSNNLGTITSPAATLTVSVPPAIVTPPTSATVPAGNNASFSVTASGTATLAYQWKKNGANISGATSATLNLNNVSATDAANYSVTVTNAVGSATSAAATLTVLVPPALATLPVSASVAQGANATFTASATGTAPLSFQWFKDGALIPGATSNVLTLAAVTTADAGNYSLVVTNTVGSAASSSAALTVLVPPTILTSPTDTTVLAGNNASFTVTASGSTPLAYQWKKNGVSLSGANAATLNLNNVSATDTAGYSVTITNSAGAATSAAATLTVLLPPAIVTQPANQFGAIGATINLSVIASGTATLSYQWFQHGVALTDGGNISGSATSTLTIAGLTTNEVDSYFVVVTNVYGSVTSVNANVSINASPIITVPPASQVVARSNNVVFTVTVTGTGPLAYHWRKNGTNLVNAGTVSGATTPTLSLATVTTNNNGNYSVVITNIYGSTTSAVATLAVFTPPAITGQPTNRAVKVGTNVTFAVTATGSGPLKFQWSKNGSPLTDGGNISGALTNVLKISALTTADAGAYSVSVANAVGSVNSSNGVLTVLVPPAIVTQPVSQTIITGNPVTFGVTATGTASLRYQWRKAGVAIAGATNAIYSLAAVKTTDATNYSVVVTNLAGSVTSSNASLTVLVAPVFTLQATNRAVKIGSNTVFRATVAGTAPFAYQWFKDGNPLTNGGNISGSISNALTVSTLTTNDAGIYFLTVSNAAGAASSTNAVLTVLVPPAIVTQPVSQTIVASNAVTFSVSATGTAPLRYQWRKAGVAIAGATNANYSLAKVKTTDAAVYSVVVTNRAGSVTSSNATLKVVLLPVFTTQPGSRTVSAGSITVFSATVTGTAPFQFQWFKNGKPLVNGGNVSGASSNVLMITSINSKNAGIYTLAVTNPAGGIVSSGAALIVTSSENDSAENSRVSTRASLAPAPALTLAIAVNTAPTAQVAAKVAQSAASGVTLKANGTAGASYILQATADLIHWTNLQTNNADAQGVIQFTDAKAATASARFYRLAQP